MLSYFAEFSTEALMIDFFWASLLLFIGQFLRLKVKLLQNLFLPASCIAGVIGLLLSDEFFGVIGFSSQMSSYPTVLIIMLFATLLWGPSERHGNFFQTAWSKRDSVLLQFAWGITQFSIAILVGWVLARTIFPNLDERIGVLMPAGFYRGYGYGGAVGGALENYGFDAGIGLGMTFATLGMLVGIIFGIININIANRKGYLKFCQKLSDIPEEMRSGRLEGSARFSIGTATFNPSSIDPLGWHWVLMFMAAGLGWLTNYYIRQLTNVDVPALCLAMLWGLALQKIMNAVKLGTTVDKPTMTRVGSTVTDFLVFFGFCTIRKEVISSYWAPVLILAVVGIIINMVWFWYVCPRLMHNYWFERGIIVFGMFCGVMATGVTLLRIVDPENKTEALEDTGIACTLMGFWDLFQIGMYPIFIGMGHTLLTGSLILLGAVATFILMRIVKCWHKPTTYRSEE